MKRLLNNWRIPTAISAVVFAAVLVVPRANADEWNKRTILSVNETIQVENAVLPPGQYVLRLLNSNSDRHVVQIFNSRENHVIATILAIPAERLNPTGETQFTFWETPAGTAKAMRDWYYPGDLIGQEFTYPKHPYQLVAVVTPPPAPAVAPPPAPPAAPPEAAQQPAPPPQQEAAAPPPAQPEAQPAPPVEQPAPPPAALPKTATPYPLFGLAGLVLLAFGGLLKLRFSQR